MGISRYRYVYSWAITLAAYRYDADDAADGCVTIKKRRIKMTPTATEKWIQYDQPTYVLLLYRIFVLLVVNMCTDWRSPTGW